MKKYIIFFVTWFISIVFGFLVSFLMHSDQSIGNIVTLWFAYDLFYEVLIGYAIAFLLVIALYIKDKMKKYK